jgi:transposase
LDQLTHLARTYCGIDWADDHHDIAIIDESGTVLASKRIDDTADGLTILLDLLAAHGDSAEQPIPVAIETSRGLLVACLRGSERPIYAINPMAVARYRDRSSIAGRKSDAFDARTLANILRTDAHEHRALPADSTLVQAIRVLARAQQDAVWDRVQMQNRLRAHLRQYYPAFLTAYEKMSGGLGRPDARAVLAIAPTPARAGSTSRTQLRAALRKAGRQRGIEPEVERLHGLFREVQMRQLQLVEDAMGNQCLALLRQLDATASNIDELEQALVEAFNQHPDATIMTSFPGMAAVSAARVLGEIGDDRTRFADARGLKAYAGSAPITRASGKSTFVSRRRIKNRRLADAGYNWTLASLRNSPGARAHYDRRRELGDRHSAAQRNLYNRFLGMLFYCLQNQTLFDEKSAFYSNDPEGGPSGEVAATTAGDGIVAKAMNWSAPSVGVAAQGVHRARSGTESLLPS